MFIEKNKRIIRIIMHWKHVLMVSGAALATMYIIRYLRASNTMVASLYPTPQPTVSNA